MKTLLQGQVEGIARAYLMSLQGIYLTTRKPNSPPQPNEISKAKLEILNASSVFESTIGTLLDTYDTLNGAHIKQDALADIEVVSSQLIKITVKAIVSGHSNGAATLLGNVAHGAMGELVGRAAGQLQFTVRDKSGRSWSDATKLFRAIIWTYVTDNGGKNV